MDIETATPNQLRKYILDLNVRLVQATTAYENTLTHCKKVSKQKEALEQALAFCEECMRQHLNVDDWLEELNNIKEGKGNLI